MRALRRVLRIFSFLGVAVASAGFFFYAEFKDNLEVTHYDYKTAKLPSSFAPKKLAVLTDIHNHSLDYENGNLLDKIDAEHPNAIVCLGDFVDDHTKEQDFVMFGEMLSFFQVSGYPVYYVSGNHEETAPKEITERLYSIFDKYGAVSVMREKINLFGTEVTLTGLEDPGLNKKEKIYIADYFGDIPEQLEKIGKPDLAKVNLVLAHRPVILEKVAPYGYDYQFSGHIHGGQLVIGKMPLATWPWKKYTSGIYNEDKTMMLLSRGLGYAYNLPVRYNCAAELAFVTIKSAAS